MSDIFKVNGPAIYLALSLVLLQLLFGELLLVCNGQNVILLKLCLSYECLPIGAKCCFFLTNQKILILAPLFSFFLNIKREKKASVSSCIISQIITLFFSTKWNYFQRANFCEDHSGDSLQPPFHLPCFLCVIQGS